MPGWFTSLMTVPEQTIEPSGESKKILPTGAALSWYGVFSAVAWTGAGSGSLTPWPADVSLVVTVLSASFADCIRSGFHSPSITGLTKSLASLSHLPLSQFFQPPFFQSSTSMPCSSSWPAMSDGMPILPSPALSPALSPAPSAPWEAVAPAWSAARCSSEPLQAVAVSARAATRPVAARTVRRRRCGVAGVRMERMVR
ncbi:hypothetical protein SGLAM104S_03463 [Streptomyces glaucescens]